MKDLQHVHLIPTYRCNLDCSYCYSAKYRNMYGEMSWNRFAKILDSLLINNIKKIQFIGGEPTLWRHIDRAIKLSSDSGFNVSLLTNCIIRVKNLPGNVLVNGNNLLREKSHKKIIENLIYYRSKGVIIGLRFNLDIKTTDKMLSQYLEWGIKYADHINAAPIIPHGLDRKLGKKIYKFCKMIADSNKMIKLSRAIPLCLFAPAETRFLKKTAHMHHRCMPAATGIAINPDGSFLACVNLSICFHPKDYDKINMFKAKCAPVIEKIKTVPSFAQCSNCRHYLVKCIGGCLGMRNNLNELIANSSRACPEIIY